MALQQGHSAFEKVRPVVGIIVTQYLVEYACELVTGPERRSYYNRDQPASKFVLLPFTYGMFVV